MKEAEISNKELLENFEKTIMYYMSTMYADRRNGLYEEIKERDGTYEKLLQQITERMRPDTLIKLKIK